MMRHELQTKVTPTLSEHYRAVEKQMDIDIAVLVGSMTEEQKEEFINNFHIEPPNLEAISHITPQYVTYSNGLHERDVDIEFIPIEQKLAIIEAAERILK